MCVCVCVRVAWTAQCRELGPEGKISQLCLSKKSSKFTRQGEIKRFKNRIPVNDRNTIERKTFRYSCDGTAMGVVDLAFPVRMLRDGEGLKCWREEQRRAQRDPLLLKAQRIARMPLPPSDNGRCLLEQE